jgi:hypothetical protein
MMPDAIKNALKRGVLVTAANWEVVVIQFVAESAFKALLMVPVVGAAVLVALIVGSSVGDLIASDLRQAVVLALDALSQHLGALTAYVAGVAVVMLGGSILMFVVKSGTVAVLVAAEAQAPAIEQPPLRVERVRMAARFSLETFSEGCSRFWRRFVRVGLILAGVYGATGAAYLGALYAIYLSGNGAGVTWAGTVTAAMASTLLVAWITVVNLAYLLVQLAIVSQDLSVRAALVAVPRFVADERRLVGGIFLAVIVVVLLATAASILATGALGFIGFVPVVGLAMLPLQLLAWLGRGLVFEFLGLTALGAYASVLRKSDRRPAGRALGASVETRDTMRLGI